MALPTTMLETRIMPFQVAAVVPDPPPPPTPPVPPAKVPKEKPKLPPAPGSCPICGKFKSNMYYHAKASHGSHPWTLEEARSIGAFACVCGKLLRNDSQALIIHQAKSGCQLSQASKPSEKQRPKAPADGVPFKLCPVCGRNKGADVFLHAKMMHSGHHWTKEEAEAIGAWACGCGTVLRNDKAGLNMHRIHTGCRHGLDDDNNNSNKNENAAADATAPCPICHEEQTQVYYHARTQHKKHKWTLLEAMSIGAYACSCGKLVRDPVWGVAWHRQRSGCTVGVEESDTKPVIVVDDTQYDLDFTEPLSVYLDSVP